MLDTAGGKHELSMKSKCFLRNTQQILKCGVDSRLNDLLHSSLSSVYQLIQLQAKHEAKKIDRFFRADGKSMSSGTTRIQGNVVSDTRARTT